LTETGNHEEMIRRTARRRLMFPSPTTATCLDSISLRRTVLLVTGLVFTLGCLASLPAAAEPNEPGQDGESPGEIDTSDLPWTTGRAEVPFTEITPAQAREKALELARRDVVEKAVAGIRVKVVDDLWKGEEGDEIIERYSRLVHCEVSGRIVAEKEPIFQFVAGDSGGLVCVCTLTAKVIEEHQERDPGFIFNDVGLYTQVTEKEIVPNTAGVFRNGERVVLAVEVSRDCYLTVFNVYEEGSVLQVVPNEEMPVNFVTAGRRHEFPSAEDRQRSVELPVSIPPGRKSCLESFVIVATLDEYPFRSEEKVLLPGGNIPQYKTAFDRMNRWLLHIPADRRVEAHLSYTIVK